MGAFCTQAPAGICANPLSQSIMTMTPGAKTRGRKRSNARAGMMSLPVILERFSFLVCARTT
jgi:hypothetical protein